MDEGRPKASTRAESRANALRTAASCTPKRVKRLKPEAALVAAAVVFKALSDETRLHILRLLAESDADLCACDIEERFSLAQPTISHHMRILRDAALVAAEKRGAWVYYSVEPAGMRALDAAAKIARPNNSRAR